MTKTVRDIQQQETVYAAIELSKKSWVVSIARPDRGQPSIHRIAGGNFSTLIDRLRSVAKNIARILVCYEAGYDGFWLARSLIKVGIECRVLDPASLQVNRRARRVKRMPLHLCALLWPSIAATGMCAPSFVCPLPRKKMPAVRIVSASA